MKQNDNEKIMGGNSTPQPSKVDLTRPETLEACTWIEFPAGITWAPEKMEINGRKGRRVICVLAQDKLHYRIFDLDGSPSIEDANAIGAGKGDEIMS